MDLTGIRKDFPILERRINNNPLVYFDNAATTQIPDQVLSALADHYRCRNGNVHRGIHTLSEESSAAFEQARKKTAAFLNAGSEECIVFTQGATDGLNMIALGLEYLVNEGDVIISTELEHHSNYLPWQQICKRKGARFLVIPQKDGDLDITAYKAMLSDRVKIVAAGHVSNLTGSVNPVKEICSLAKSAGALTVIDGAQALRHDIVNVQDIGCDFYCFSGHKVLSPCGIGVICGSRKGFELLKPVKYGGGMVDTVYEKDCTLGLMPYRFEAGTGSYALAVALSAALGYIENTGREEIAVYEDKLLSYIEEQLSQIPEIRILGHPVKRAGCISFTIDKVHPYDCAKFLDAKGIAVRSGNHCAQPALKSLGADSAVRVSPAFYNTFEEADVFIQTLKIIIGLLSGKR